MKTNDLTHTPRERTSVFITGVDTSTPDDLVKDGMCAKLHNMRYEGSAWRPTHPYNAIKEGISLPLTATIVYHHPAVGEGKYITEFQRVGVDGSTYNYALFDINTGESTPIITLTEQAHVSHFGNVLIFFTQQAISYAILDDGAYKPFVIPPHMATSATRTSTRVIQPYCYYLSPTSEGVSGRWVSRDEISSDDRANVTKSWFPIHNVSQGTPMVHGEDNHWHGELLLFTTWRMKDGTNLSPSPLHLIKSYSGVNDRHDCKNSVYTSPSPLEKWEKGADIYLGLTKEAVGDAHNFDDFLSANLLCSSQNKVRISFPASADTSAVHSIAVWCTRPYPVFSTDNITVNRKQNSSTNFRQRDEQKIINASSFTSFYDNTNIADQPFYLLKEFELSETLTDGDIKYVEVLITSSLLDAAIHNTVYVPNNNIHSTIGNAMLDYNMRLHSADTTTILCRPYDFVDVLTDGDVKYERYQWADVEIDNILYTSVGASQRGVAFLPSSPYFNVISYPDYRAKRIGAEYLGGFTLKEAPANNFAWYHAPHTEDEKYPPIEYAASRTAVHPNDNSSVHRANHIEVSATNNCFSFPFENSYAVGSRHNRILALQSAAIEMHEMKVGELPLYAFTEEGIFALVAGAETLYASVAAINYDKIINPNTLAINGAIAYITEKGVHLLTTSGTQVISTPIHNKDNTPPLDFLRVCKMIYPKEHNEIVLLNEKSIAGVAYVYNLDAGYWSTRDLKGIKLNTDELYYDNTLYDLANEDESKALPVEIITRPIKLGDVEFKRLETIIPRMATTTEDVLMDMYVDGSVDGKYYRPLRKLQAFNIDPDSVNPVVLRRTPFSAKYFTCKMQLDVAPDETTFNASITHIDFEWYRKLRHRMR